MAKAKTEPTDYPHDDLVRGVDVQENDEWYPAYGEAKLLYRAWQRATNTQADTDRDDHKIFDGVKDDV